MRQIIKAYGQRTPIEPGRARIYSAAWTPSLAGTPAVSAKDLSRALPSGSASAAARPLAAAPMSAQRPRYFSTIALTMPSRSMAAKAARHFARSMAGEALAAATLTWMIRVVSPRAALPFAPLSFQL